MHVLGEKTKRQLSYLLAEGSRSPHPESLAAAHRIRRKVRQTADDFIDGKELSYEE